MIEASNDEHLPDANSGALRDILSRWSASMAALVLNEVECRLRLMAELRGKLSVIGVDEVHELQPLFKRGLWMFGPHFESAEFTANEGMTTVIQRLLKLPEGTGSRCRPDFVVLPDSSVGLYACPSFDDIHEVDGIDHLVIIELKTTGKEIGSREREQVWKYYKELRKVGCIKPHTRVDAYILGDCIESGEEFEAPYPIGVRIRPMLYETILKRAEKRLLNLYGHIKHAPFLKGAVERSPSQPDVRQESAAAA
ncbi:hypothetical protein ACFJIX_06815 [Roseateles sp. UC29_93]|uniref:hypothetical protein n=1 Tax=Roseateles sp. UC29_93 TaxID=3350177 RepID=UPI00367107BC